jgi:thioredoxin reductase (NADPH)
MLKKFVLCCLAFAAPLPSAEEEAPVVILGSGIAALTAAVQASQAGVQPVVITGASPGGIITQSHSVQNWPGEIEITGADLADKLQKQAEARNVRFITSEVIDIDTSKRPFVITTKNLIDQSIQKIKARTCIVALGASPKLLNVPGESDYLFKKIFTCAPCDGLRFKDKTVAIIGGGDSALTEAHYLSNIAKKIYIVVRSDKFKAIQQKEILSNPKIEVLYNTSVESFREIGDQLSMNFNSSKELTVDGVFLAIGSQPNSALFKGKLELDREGYIVLKDDQETSVRGIYAAGDISDKKFRQAMTAAGDATKAVLQAQKDFGSISTTKQVAASSKMQELASLQDLRKLFGNSKKYTVVYFYGPTCPPCRAFRSTYDQWATQFNDKAVFAKVSSQTAQDCFIAYRIEGVPTIIVFDEKGRIVQQATGLQEIGKIPLIFN